MSVFIAARCRLKRLLTWRAVNRRATKDGPVAATPYDDAVLCRPVRLCQKPYLQMEWVAL